MRKSRHISLLLIFLVVGANAYTERIQIHYTSYFNPMRPDKIDISFEIPIFEKYEDFTIESPQIAAFATGWRQWHGYPQLNDDDVLCYIPRSINCTFPYVFFCHGDKKSRFQINGNIVFRDGKPYGLAIKHDDMVERIDLDILREVSYIFLNGDFIDKQVQYLSNVCANTKYVCTNSREELTYSLLLEKLPIEYIHFAPFTASYSRNAEYRATPGSISVTSRVLWASLDIMNCNVLMSRMKYVYIASFQYENEWNPDNFPALEGIILNYYCDEVTEKFISALSSQLRILYFSDDPIDKKKNRGTSLLESILCSESIEYISMGRYTIPEGKKMKTNRLKMLISKSDSSILDFILYTDKIEMLSLKEIIGFDNILFLQNLQILEVCSIAEHLESWKPLNLRELHIEHIISNAEQFKSIVESCPNGRVFIKSFHVSSDVKWSEFSLARFPSEISIFWLSCDSSVEMFFNAIKSLLRNCNKVWIMTTKTLPNEIQKDMLSFDSIEVFMTRDGMYIPSRKIKLGFEREVECLFIANFIACSEYVYNYEMLMPTVNRTWFFDSIVDFRLTSP